MPLSYSTFGWCGFASCLSAVHFIASADGQTSYGKHLSFSLLWDPNCSSEYFPLRASEVIPVIFSAKLSQLPWCCLTLYIAHCSGGMPSSRRSCINCGISTKSDGFLMPKHPGRKSQCLSFSHHVSDKNSRFTLLSVFLCNSI